MEQKYVIAGCLLALALYLFVQYVNNRKWENLLIDKQKSFNTNKKIRRTSDKLISSMAVCLVAAVGITVIPVSLPFDGGVRSMKNSMSTDAVMPESAEEEVTVMADIKSEDDGDYESYADAAENALGFNADDYQVAEEVEALESYEVIEETDEASYLYADGEFYLLKDGVFYRLILK